MGDLPSVTADDVRKIVPNCCVISGPHPGGQKIVYCCKIADDNYALKFIKIGEDGKISKDGNENLERIKREFSTLSICSSPYLIGLGPIKMTVCVYGRQVILYYSEPWVQGYNLHDTYVKTKSYMNSESALLLAKHISLAIEELWSHGIIHRDIKPQNIMFDESSNQYILLDMGMIYDASLVSLTQCGYLVGTIGYHSPEQLLMKKKGALDFRSDLFCLGIVLYELTTNVHPFKCNAKSQDEVFQNILNLTPRLPHEINSQLHPDFSSIIMRLLKKHASERFRSVSIFREELDKCKGEI